MGRAVSKLGTWLKRPSRLALLALLAGVAGVGWSYTHALIAPGTDGLGARSVEWVRQHGGSGLVRFAEHQWYGHHKPRVGGTVQGDNIPRVSATHRYRPSSMALPRPPDIPPLITATTVAGEGRWMSAGSPVDGAPPLYVTFVRPDPQHSSVAAGVAWMDTNLLRADLYAGYEVPGGRDWSPSGPIKPSDGDLVAAFNSGFRLQDSAGSGYYSRGRTAAPVVNGYASLVIYADGRATVGMWGRDVTATPDVVSIRQNLPLIVDGTQPVSGLTSDRFQLWGATLGNRAFVWRSGLGVTGDGALVYVSGANLSIYTLARSLAMAGAVRAMELDINTDWVDFIYFDPPFGAAASADNATKLLSSMVSSKKRYFEPSSKDFVAMFADPAGAEARVGSNQSH